MNVKQLFSFLCTSPDVNQYRANVKRLFRYGIFLLVILFLFCCFTNFFLLFGLRCMWISTGAALSGKTFVFFCCFHFFSFSFYFCLALLTFIFSLGFAIRESALGRHFQVRYSFSFVGFIFFLLVFCSLTSTFSFFRF